MRAITGELQADEIALLEKALHYYGRQPKRWEIICRDHLPHRQPNVRHGRMDRIGGAWVRVGCREWCGGDFWYRLGL